MNTSIIARSIHAGIGLILLISHAVFFFRALAMRRREWQPKRLDRVARAGSHWGLPLAIITGIIASRFKLPDGLASSLFPAFFSGGGPGTGLPIIHITLGLAPLLTIVVFAVLRPLKVRIPWILPAINLVLLLLATISGIFSAF